MKMKKISVLLFGAGVLALTSCNEFLDKLPDDRAEVNTFEKATQLVTSAYATSSPAFMMEWSSDNVTDNGKTFNYRTNQDQVYRWQDVNTTGNDDPRNVWGEAYAAVGCANQVIADLSKVTDGNVAAVRAEALLCRAWAVFCLSNAFCMAYDDAKADQYLGLPYPKEANQTVDKRGTLRELYENINADIEAALPDISEEYMTKPKYHFNQRAAYAFAARFNLYYQKWDKAAEYATRALGTQPASLMRNVSRYNSLSGGRKEIHDNYISSSENANFMLQTAISYLGYAARSSSFARYNFGADVVNNELYWGAMPWGTGTINNTLYESHLLYGSNQQVVYPKLTDIWEYTDNAKSRGYIHVVNPVLTADETLLVRAEAQVMLNKYTEALNDMNTWISVHCSPTYGNMTRPTLTLASVKEFFDGQKTVPAEYESADSMGVKKALHPQGFTVDETQTNLLYAVLQMRRIETCMQGLRFMDIKRYGIEFPHLLDGEQPIFFKAGDLRGALQLPADVIEAGMEPNPRTK